MKKNNKKESIQQKFEKNIFAMYLFVAISISLAGIIEIVPLFTNPDTIKKEVLTPEGKKQSLLWQRGENDTFESWKPGDGVRPYSPLELAGRDIYQREGCYLCHSQMIRPFRDEDERYGHYSLAVESMYDHPFQWGSKRTGPDLARVADKYSDEWHLLHMRNPQAVVPSSVMPKYQFLENAKLNPDQIKKRMMAMTKIGVPYTESDINNSHKETRNKTEMDAMIAYLQSLGNMIKFDKNITYRK